MIQRRLKLAPIHAQEFRTRTTNWKIGRKFYEPKFEIYQSSLKIPQTSHQFLSIEIYGM